MQNKHVRTLIGWKEIASYLNCSLSSARRREREGLPVFRVGGSVRASTRDIDSWIKKGLRRNSAKAAEADAPPTDVTPDVHELFSGFTVERNGRRFVVVSLEACGSEPERAVGNLKAPEEKYRQLLEKVPVWIWETDAGGTYTYSNEEVFKMLGYRPKEIVGRTPAEVGIPRADLRPVEEAFASFPGDANAIKQLEHRALHRDGSPRRLLTYAEAARDADGNFAGIRGVSCDVTTPESAPGEDPANRERRGRRTRSK
jgi:PAS domain S-box-containing protein